jgi:nitrous oxidase accessory protein
MKRVFLSFLVVLATAAALGAGRAGANEPGPRVVTPGGVYQDLQAALQDAEEGDLIRVEGGVVHGPLVIDKRVVLQGEGWPVIDGGGQGTVVTVNAPGTVVRGFHIQGSGIQPDRDHAGLEVAAPDVLVEGNRFTDVLFGVFVAESDRATIRGNEITSKPGYDLARQGDGIRVWYSQQVVIEGNLVREARDVVLWYSKDLVVRDNTIENGRYGLHLMYCDGASLENNRLYNNSVGIYTMYSSTVLLRGNDLRGQRGPSGYGLGFKEVDNLLVEGNLMVDNRAGLFIDGVPFRPEGYAHFQNNFIAYNDIGITLIPTTQGAEFQANTFWENGQQVAVEGQSKPAGNAWLGNFWSDYNGLDADGDGTGDTPYLAERTFENFTDREPLLRALNFSPAVQAVELAAQTFPIFLAQPRLVDPAPMYSPAPPPVPANQAGSAGGVAAAGWLLAALLLVFGGGFYYAEVHRWNRMFEREGKGWSQ